MQRIVVKSKIHRAAILITNANHDDADLRGHTAAVVPVDATNRARTEALIP